MFRKNTTHLQISFFDIENQLSGRKRKKIRESLGLNKMDDTAFCEATFFNFQNRLLKHFVETGEN